MKPVAACVAGVVTAACGSLLLVGGWLLSAAGGAESGCDAAPAVQAVPAQLAPIFSAASVTYGLGADGPAILAALTKTESDFGRDLGPSSAGAIGWTQFLPSTWRAFGVDADGDGRADPMTPADAIYSAAGYLRHLGAPRDWHRALLGYNHSETYVATVLRRAQKFAAPSSMDALLACDVTGDPLPSQNVQRLVGGGRIVAIPGLPGESVDERILRDVTYLMSRYRVTVTDGYAPTGHAPGGEHPLGLAVDLVPGPGGTWDEVDALARWAEPRQNEPRRPFRWVGYDGDPGHGRGNHLHLSWMHGPAPSRRPPAPWVLTFSP